MIFYCLSSRQLATLDSGESLRIALPITYDFPNEGTPQEQSQWFRDSIDNACDFQSRSFERVTLWAHLTNRGGSLTNEPEAMTLATRLGELVDERNREKLPCYPVECFVATIGDEPKTNKPPRWPNGRMVYVKHQAD